MYHDDLTQINPPIPGGMTHFSSAQELDVCAYLVLALSACVCVACHMWVYVYTHIQVRDCI